MRTARLSIVCAAIAALLSCTDASLYSIAGMGANLADRARFEGLICTPSAGGPEFPTRVLYVVEGGTAVDNSAKTQVLDAIEAGVQRFEGSQVRFGFVAFNAFAFNLLENKGFGDSLDFTLGVTRYGSFAGDGPPSIARALDLAESLISGELINQCPGERARTRYSVVLIVFQNQGDPDDCLGAGPCEAEAVALKIRDLQNRYGVGKISVQPVYVETGSAETSPAPEQMRRIAAAAGTVDQHADLPGLKGLLQGMEVAGLGVPLKLKSVLAFNRSARARAGELRADTDGDGLPDADEPALGLDPLNADSDGDVLLDGVEILAGLDPLTPNEVRGCEPMVDGDLDGLTSCEERLLGTDDCMGDSDWDAIPDIVEALEGTNARTAEQAADTDRDGFSNLDELRRHTDATSTDLQFIGSKSYAYDLEELPATMAGSESDEPDPCPGQVRYRVTVSNIGLAETGTLPDRERGANDIYLWAVFAPEGMNATLARSTAIQVIFIPPNTRKPEVATIPLNDEEFEVKP